MHRSAVCYTTQPPHSWGPTGVKLIKAVNYWAERGDVIGYILTKAVMEWGTLEKKEAAAEEEEEEDQANLVPRSAKMKQTIYSIDVVFKELQIGVKPNCWNSCLHFPT